MGTLETRSSSKALALSPESDKTKSPNEKALKKVNENLGENHSGSVKEGVLGLETRENGVKTGSGEKKKVKIAAKERVSGEEDESNGVSLADNDVKHDGSASDSEDVEQGQGFCVGDFVWGKIKSHPWWPGQIYDPSQASDFAAAKMRRGSGDHRYLVAYFGDGTFAWCQPSQLKPFVENFSAMSGQSNAKSFCGAVRRAMDEITRALERTLTCPCVPENNRVGLGRSVADNFGVKEDSLVPEAKVGKLSDFLSEPSEILSLLRHIAQDVHGVREDGVQVDVLRTRLSAFFRSKGVCELPRYLNPVPVLGLEDKENESDVVEVPARGPFEDWTTQTSQADRPSLQSCQAGSEGKRTPRRKQMSIAELIAREKTSPEEEEKTKLTLESSEAKESSGGSKGKKSKKEKGIVRSSEKPQFEKSPSFREKKKSKYLSPPFVVASGSKKKLKESETEVPEVSTPKDMGPRTSGDKNSNQETKAEVSRTQVLSTNEVLSEVRSAAADPLSQREKDSVEKVVDFMSAFRGSVYSDGTNPRSRKKKKKRKSEASESVAKDQDNDENKSKFPESESGGKDTNDEKKRKSLETKSRGKDPNDKNKRKSPESKSGGKDPNDVKKRKSPESKSGRKDPNDVKKRKSQESKSGGKDPIDEKKRKSPESKSGGKDPSEEKKRKSLKSKSGGKDPDVHSERKQSVKARGRKRKQETENPEETVGEKSEAEVKTPETKSRKRKVKKVEDPKETVDEKILPATLIVEFAPASTLPTKSDLIKMYGKYGELDEVKTDMYYNNKCARIYFLNGSNAELAYNDSKSSSPFGSNTVEFVLECPSHEYKTRELNEITPTKEAVVETPKKKVSKSKPKEKSKENGAPGIGYVKEKLERISKMLEGEISEKWRSKLKREVSGLSQKVNAMAGSST